MREDENPITLLFESFEQKVQNTELHAVQVQVIPINEGWPWLLAIEEVGVVASFPQLHEHIEHLLTVIGPVDGVDITSKNLLVRHFLHLTHAHI